MVGKAWLEVAKATLQNLNLMYKLIEEMLQQAIKKKGTEGSLILHSDQGWQYQMPQYQKN
ncbi:hypothetical protein EfmJHP9_01780 [Enterococcus faecium]|nr:hypothetical protein EfmJHP9_01780 [Enterococcus faecium]